MYTKVLLCVFIGLPLLISCAPSVCNLYSSDGSQMQCLKSTYRSDIIYVKNIAGTPITFNIVKWLSYCGKPGVKYSEEAYRLAEGEKVSVSFPEAISGTCNELFVRDCKKDMASVDCVTVVSASPHTLF